MQKNLIWFRNDLRIYDNIALYNACLSDIDQVIGLFIFIPKQWNSHYFSMKKISFLHQHLILLQKNLLKLNIFLHYKECPDFIHESKYLLYFCHKQKINNLFYNYQYEYNESNRDDLITKKLSQHGIFVKGFHNNILIEPDKIKNQNNQSYKKFYFFKKNVINYLLKNIPICKPIPKIRNIHISNVKSVNLINKFDVNFNQNIFPIGEKNAIKKLTYFFTYKLEDYYLKRNFPYLNNTSMISPYLSLGIISVRHCIKIILKQNVQQSLITILNSSWINEIMWREFYYHLLINFPILGQSKSLFQWEKKINWENNENYFNAWKQGNTGFPIIDASMKQLKYTGWMHNRLRMLTASFLVKNLLIDWRKGEKYFMQNLIDGDYALNNGGWQWSASVGSDSMPYIRIFNPLRQSKIFDSLGTFIKQYLPKLKIVPNQYIHNPHEWLLKHDYKINYPKPIISYKNSKEKFLQTYKIAKLL